MNKKVFISYSWSTPSHQKMVQSWADRLIADGVDIILDIYDLKEGDDKYAFMEKMVTDKSVTHVLIICDKEYARKADKRKSGVGTESQIISSEIYEKVEQSKFIPIICEFDNDNLPYLPTFLKARIWLDFSTMENVNENWERLIRLIFDKPLNIKPKLGKPPSYLSASSSEPSTEPNNKFQTLKQAILQGKNNIQLYRDDFLTSTYNYADKLRIRTQPNLDNLPNLIFEDIEKLKQIRDITIDWILLEVTSNNQIEFAEHLIGFLEKLLDLKSKPPELNQWNDRWFEAHSIFVNENFLYIIASLLKMNAYEVLHEIFTTHYLLPEDGRHPDRPFSTFHSFWSSGEIVKSSEGLRGKNYYSPVGELIKRHADRSDIPFQSIFEAELLIILMSFIIPNTRWFPQTLYYFSYYKTPPFFLRATQHKYFKKLAIITGINDVEKLKSTIKEGQQRLNTNNWNTGEFGSSFWEIMNIDKFDSIK